MSFNEFQNDVNGLMDILWSGGVASHATIIEQINYLMFLRALTKKDDNAIALDEKADQMFSGKLSRFRWDNLLMLNAEALFTTLEEIFRTLPELTTDKTIRQLFQDAHVKVFDKPTLRRVVHEIDKMMSEMDKEYVGGHTDVFGDMYEHLLSKMAQAGTLGQFRTPRHIIDFIVDVVDPSKGETILDPACGTAGFLISSLKHLKQKYTSEEYKKENRLTLDLLKPEERQFLFNNTFTGFDSDFEMFKFGLMNLYLHHLEHPNLKRQNTLVDTAGDRTKWDIVLANPPFAGAVDEDSISEDLRMGTRATEILFLKYIINHLSPNGRAGVIVPEGVVTTGSNAYKKIRNVLVEEAGLWCVVSLPGGVFNPYAGVKTSILFFDKKLKNSNDEILFIKIKNDGFDLGATKRPIELNDLPEALRVIKDWKNGVKDTTSIASIVEKQKVKDSGDYNLLGSRYKTILDYSNVKWEMVELGSVCEILDSKRKPVTKSNRKKGKFPYYGATGILDYVDNYIFNEKLVLVGEDGAKWGEGEKTAFIAEGEYWVNNHAHVLRPIRTKVIDEYLVGILNHMDLTPFITGVTVPKLNQEKLKSIKIPVPPIEVQEKLVKDLVRYQKIIDGSNLVISNWKPVIKISPKWEKVKIGDICLIERGASPRPIEKYITNDPNGLSWIKIGDVKTAAKYITKTAVKITREGAAKSRKVNIGDFVLSNSMSFGRPYIMKIEGYIHDGWLRLSVNSSKVTKDFLYYILGSELVIDQFENAATGGVVRNLNSELVRDTEIFIPTLIEQQNLVKEIEEERILVESCEKLIDTYRCRIKSLLSKIWEA